MKLIQVFVLWMSSYCIHYLDQKQTFHLSHIDVHTEPQQRALTYSQIIKDRLTENNYMMQLF